MRASVLNYRESARPGPSGATACDITGRVWAHPNPLHLYRWLSRRNELLRTLAATPQSSGRRHAG